MVYIKPEFLRRQKSIDLADTFKYDELPEKGLSAGLILKIDSPAYSGMHYTYAKAGDKYRLVDWIDEVKVITDGKRPLKDMGGAELQASEYWNTKQTAVDQLSDRTLIADHCLIPLAWGRHLGDLEYYLNWGNYDSIELNVKNTMITTLFETATIDIINLKIMDGMGLPPSKGVFQERIWRTYTTVQDQIKYLKLPASSPLRRIMLRGVPAYETSYPYRRSCNFDDLMEDFKLDFGDGGEVALDTYGIEHIELMHMLHDGLVQTEGLLLAAVADDVMIRTGIGRARSKSIVDANVTTTARAYDHSFLTYTDDLQCPIITAGASNQYVHWIIIGIGYNNVIPIRFDLGGVENILDAVAKKPINLEIHTGDDSTYADGTMQVILSELVSR